MTKEKLDLKQKLHLFASPAAEAMDEGGRITEMCKASWEAIARIEDLEAENKRLRESLEAAEEGLTVAYLAGYERGKDATLKGDDDG